MLESKYLVSWDNVNTICEHLTTQLKSTESKFEAIVPITRGGLVAGTILSHKLGITDVVPIAWQTRDGGRRDVDLLQRTLSKYNSVLIVDDILDSGLCLREIATIVHNFVPNDRANVTYAVMFNNVANETQSYIETSGPIVHSVSIDRTVDARFIHFPWEVIS